MNKLIFFALTLAVGGFATLSASDAQACDTCGCRGDAPDEAAADEAEEAPAQRHAAHFASVDVDESGGISFEEFTTAMTERHAARAAGSTCEGAGEQTCNCGNGRGGWRADVDTDGDGEVSDEERDAHFLVRFAELDSDESGEVSAEEMQAAHPERPGHGHGGHGHGHGHGDGHGHGHGNGHDH